MPQGLQALLALLVLLPGFVSARIARSISAPCGQTDVERVIEALIFSFFIYVIYLLVFGGRFPLEWSTATAAGIVQYSVHVHHLKLLFLTVNTILLGVIWGALQYHDVVLGQLRKWDFTDRTNDVSVWNGTLKQLSGSVQVGLADGREVIGWLQRYSDTSEERALFLTDVAWVEGDGSVTRVPGPGILLTDKADIRYIMFLGETVGEQPMEVSQ